MASANGSSLTQRVVGKCGGGDRAWGQEGHWGSKVVASGNMSQGGTRWETKATPCAVLTAPAAAFRIMCPKSVVLTGKVSAAGSQLRSSA